MPLMRYRIKPGRERQNQVLAKIERPRVVKQMLAGFQFVPLGPDLFSRAFHEDLREAGNGLQSLEKADPLNMIGNLRKNGIGSYNSAVVFHPTLLQEIEGRMGDPQGYEDAPFEGSEVGECRLLLVD